MTAPPKDRAALVELMAEAIATNHSDLSWLDAAPWLKAHTIGLAEAALRAAEDVGVGMLPDELTADQILDMPDWVSRTLTLSQLRGLIEIIRKTNPFRRRD